MFAAWITSVFRHWIAVLAGAVVSVGLLLYDRFGSGQSIPDWLFYSGVAVGLLTACFLSWRDEVVRASTLDADLRKIRSASPKLEIVGQKWVRLFAGGQYRFHVLGIWIVNRPDVRTHESIARNVTIHVDVFRRGEVVPVCGLTSQWVESIDPQAVSHTGRFAAVDISANENAARCLLLLQHADTDDDCYLHSFGKLIGQPDGRYQPYRLPPGEYRAVLRFAGDNVEQELTVALVLKGRNNKPELIGVESFDVSDDGPSGAPSPDEWTTFPNASGAR
jgi:hypothetical protein